ncbi:MAG: CDP-alcohol phosphatidyltransferase family protein [Gemmatimonadota bacterium]|nr:CDP-alcohol phosphatidyltransferase family protein [Gemmatimonadota bacterium]
MPEGGSGPRPAAPGAGILPGKPLEAEEWIDEHLHRPLARPLVRLLVHTPVTPNQVTLISALLGAASGYALARGLESPRWLLGSAALLFLSVVFDCADGQLARAKRISSTYGAVIDGIADYAVGLSVAIGGSWFMVHTHGSPWFALLGLAGAASIALQAALFDHTKTRYIARIRTGYAEREEDLDKLDRDRRLAWRERRPWDALLLLIYLQYTRAQQAAMAIPVAADPDGFRARYHGRMRRWTWLGTGTTFALAYVALAIASAWPAAIAVFFLLRLTLANLLLGALVLQEKREAMA